MKENKYTSALYRTENIDYLNELLKRLVKNNISLNNIITYCDKDGIYNLELIKRDRDMKFKLIKIIKSHVRRKLISYNGKLPLYTFLSLHIPDKALVNYKMLTNDITIYTGDKYNELFYSYTSENKHMFYKTKEEAIKHCIKFACRKAFHYITGVMYL